MKMATESSRILVESGQARERKGVCLFSKVSV
jgi:hypothetical protein